MGAFTPDYFLYYLYNFTVAIPVPWFSAQADHTTHVGLYWFIRFALFDPSL